MKKKAWLSLLLAIAMIFPMFTTALAAPCNRPSSKLRQEYQLMGCRTEIVATTSTAEIYLLQLTDDITARVRNPSCQMVQSGRLSRRENLLTNFWSILMEECISTEVK